MEETEIKKKVKELEEDPERSMDEMLDWMCWIWATNAERAFPPEDTAEGCIKNFEEENGAELSERRKGFEEGYHNMMFLAAADNFMRLEKQGYDPVARAERFIEKSREEGSDLSDIDWSWWEICPSYTHTTEEDTD